MRVVGGAGELALAHAPARGGIVVEALQAAALHLLAHVNEELDQHVTVVDELALELGGRLDGAVDGARAALIARERGRLGGAALPPLAAMLVAVLALLVVAVVVLEQGVFARLGEQHALDAGGIPAAIVERDGAALAERLPELLHRRVEVLHAPRRAGEPADRRHVEVGRDVHGRGARVEPVHQVGDAAALAGAVPPLEEHHQPDVLGAGALLERGQALHELVALCLVLLLLRSLLREIDGFEHSRPLSRAISVRTARRRRYRRPPIRAYDGVKFCDNLILYHVTRAIPSTMTIRHALPRPASAGRLPGHTAARGAVEQERRRRACAPSPSHPRTVARVHRRRHAHAPSPSRPHAVAATPERRHARAPSPNFPPTVQPSPPPAAGARM